MKTLYISEQFEMSSLRDIDPERIAKTAADILLKLMKETSGPTEALASIRLVARMIKELLKERKLTEEERQSVLDASAEIIQSIMPLVVSTEEANQIMAMSTKGIGSA